MWNPFKKKGGERSLFGRLEYVNDGERTEDEEGVIGDRSEEVATPQMEEDLVEQPPEESSETEEFTEKPLLKWREAVRWLVLVTVALVPLWFLPFTAPSDVLVMAKQLLLYGLVMVSLIIWVVVIGRQGGFILRRSGWEWGILAVLGSSLLAAIFSAQVDNSFSTGEGFITLTMLTALFFVTINFFQKEDYGRLINFFLLGSSVAALIGLLGMVGAPVVKLLGLFFPANIIVGSQFNTVGTVNNLGALAAIALVLSLAYQGSFIPKPEEERGETWKKKFWPAVRIASLVIFSAVLLVINWRVFYVVVGVGMVGAILGLGFVERMTGFKSKLNPLQLVLPMVFLVVCILLVVGGRFFALDVSRVFGQSLPTEVALSQSGSWQVAKGVANVKPIFGFGDGNFIMAFDQFKPPSINNSQFWNVRFANGTSEFFNLFVERGVVGVAALAFFLFCVLRSVFVKEKRGEGEEATDLNKSAGRYLWIIMPAFLASLVLFALFPFPLVLLVTFWFLIALMGVAGADKKEVLKIKMDDASLPSVVTSLVLVVVLVVGAIGGYVLFQKYSGHIYFARAARVPGANQEDVNRAIDLLNKAIAADSRNDLFLGNFGTLVLRRIGIELNNKTDKPEEVRARLETLTRAAIQVANQMTVVHKNDAINWFNAGFMYENLTLVLSGADEAAIAAYREYLKKAPQDPNGYVRIGSIYLARADRTAVAITEARSKKLTVNNEKEVGEFLVADYKNAQENFKKATELKPDLATALYNLGIVYERQGRLKEAIEQLRLLRSGNLNHPGLAFELALLYYRDGQKDNALAEMARAVALFSDYSNARWYLALMLEERGQTDLALGQLGEILKLEVNKDNPVVRAKIEALKAGRREIPPAKVTSKIPLEPRTPRQR